MAKLTIYQKPTCSTCRGVMTRLNEAGVDYEAINYIIEPPSRAKLEDLVTKMKASPRELLRAKETRELGVDVQTLSDAQLLDLMAEHPEIIQRPILEYGDIAVLGRPAERVDDLLAAMARGS